jgi:hypothetical protein
MRSLTRGMAIVIVAIGIGSCAYFRSLTPEAAHRNFLNNLNTYIGKDIEYDRGWLRVALRVSSEPLDNGMVRYRHRVIGECIAIFDVDPSSRKVVVVNYEGSTEQCSIPP